jgi:Lrp/AsnC family transcriptional regulator, regulator for asnA, asnC and gidA
MPEVDETDMKILETLKMDSRTPFSEMAKMFNLSEAGIRKRVIALQEKKVIQKFTIEIDPAKIGINSVSIIGLDVEPTKLLESVDKLCNFKEIKNVSTASGDHMIVMEVWTKDGRELSHFITEKIATIEGIKRICPAIIHESYIP